MLAVVARPVCYVTLRTLRSPLLGNARGAGRAEGRPRLLHRWRGLCFMHRSLRLAAAHRQTHTLCQIDRTAGCRTSLIEGGAAGAAGARAGPFAGRAVLGERGRGTRAFNSNQWRGRCAQEQHPRITSSLSRRRPRLRHAAERTVDT